MSIDIDEYQEKALRTANFDGWSEHRITAYLIAGFQSESGEAIGVLQKSIRRGEPPDILKFREECGDAFWYLAVLLDHYGQDLGTVLLENIQKLKKRYPQGYTKQADLARVDVRDRSLARQVAPELFGEPEEGE